MRLFHSATIFCCYICTCICCLKLHRADYHVGEFFFLPQFWWGALSSNVFIICAVYWSLGRRGYFGISNVVLVWNYWHIICKTKLSKYLPFTHICIYSLCQFIDTGIIMTSQRRCHVRDSQTMHSFSAIHDSSPPTSEIRLQISAS